MKRIRIVPFGISHEHDVAVQRALLDMSGAPCASWPAGVLQERSEPA